eukprot:TRINITY_DN30743_c0_g1_i1.p1 TRINITY_DN30743_c0_g1~~TRINITY_DN30743_c0_g1_i1.p1  ORF type:complete len:586 (+),score=202.75 TRINITY_DN30743_c0_g1_i1:51-1760(+)
MSADGGEEEVGGAAGGEPVGDEAAGATPAGDGGDGYAAGETGGDGDEMDAAGDSGGVGGGEGPATGEVGSDGDDGGGAAAADGGLEVGREATAVTAGREATARATASGAATASAASRQGSTAATVGREATTRRQGTARSAVASPAAPPPGDPASGARGGANLLHMLSTAEARLAEEVALRQAVEARAAEEVRALKEELADVGRRYEARLQEHVQAAEAREDALRLECDNVIAQGLKQAPASYARRLAASEKEASRLRVELILARKDNLALMNQVTKLRSEASAAAAGGAAASMVAAEKRALRSAIADLSAVQSQLMDTGASIGRRVDSMQTAPYSVSRPAALPSPVGRAGVATPSRVTRPQRSSAPIRQARPGSLRAPPAIKADYYHAVAGTGVSLWATASVGSVGVSPSVAVSVAGPRRPDEEQLRASLAAVGRTVHDIPLDGACQYRCLAWLLMGSAEQHKQIREWTVEHIERHRWLYESEVDRPPGLDEWAARIRRGSWGDLLTLQAAADRCQVDCRVVFADGTEGFTAAMRPRGPDGRPVASVGEVWLALTQRGDVDYYRPVTKT